MSRARRVFAIGMLLLCAWPARSDEPAAADGGSDRGFSVRLVDASGQPVAGASVGFSMGFGDNRFSGKNWFYDDPDNLVLENKGSERGILSNAEGIASFPARREWLKAFGGVAARHAGRGLVAIARLDAMTPTDTFEVVLQPECHISARFTSEGLKAAGIELDRTNTSIRQGNQLLAEYWSVAPQFDFYLPPGTYEWEASAQGKTNRVRREFTIARGQPKLDFGTVDLPASRLKLLEGKPAPELTDVVGWKNSPPLELSQLRGKVVLLEFWGYWCGPCVARMPDLFELHDRFASNGLAIVGVHVDLGDGVDTAQKLDEKVRESRQQLWGGRDLPFPVALVPEKRVPHQPAASNLAASLAAADYGVWSYPTQILIDRQGNFVGPYRGGDEGLEQLKKLLSAK